MQLNQLFILKKKKSELLSLTAKKVKVRDV